MMVALVELKKYAAMVVLFLNVKSNESEYIDHLKMDRTLHLLHHLQGEVPMSKSTEKVIRSKHGMNLLHHIDTLAGSCGGPLCSGLEVFGMHKAGVEYDTDSKKIFNIAVSMPSVISAISKCLNKQVHLKKPPTELKNVTDPNLLKYRPFTEGDIIYTYNNIIWFV